MALGPRQNVDPALQKFLAVIRRGVTERRQQHLHLEHGVHEGLESSLGLLLGYARLQPPESIHPAIAALLQHIFRVTDDDLRLHHDGNEDFRRAPELHAVKTGLRSEERRVGKECRSRWS